MNFNIITELKSFQKETVNWMVSQEKTKDGGLLLNEPGTGKSFCCIDLIVKTQREKDITLVICPAGLVLNWIEEIKLHSNISEEFIGVYIGKKRTKDSFKNKMIIVTSYNIVSKDSINLSNIKFKRIILDEGHYIRNSNSTFFKSIMELKSDKKWIVTATPIFNDLNDMYSYVRFLELDGIDSRSEWKSRMTKDFIGNFRYINKIISENSIRLKKSDVLKELPKKNEIDINLEMTGFEKDFYDMLWEYSLKRITNMSLRIQRLTGLKDVNSKMIRQCLSNNVLVYILRLKQCCNNPWLVIKTMTRLQNVKSIKQATECLAYYNLSMSTEEECPICYDQQANIIVSPCGHKYCESCCNKLLKHNINKCPKCRVVITSTEKIENIETTQRNETIDKIDDLDIKMSSKIEKMISIIREKLYKNEKVVVVSQWISMLELAKSAVEKEFNTVKSITLQGDIPIITRSNLITKFKEDSEIKICYVSLMSSAEGINLTVANNLIMLDTWWNNSKMLQVHDRIHRIGQTKEVNIYKLIITNSNSIETKIIELVNKKSKISNLIVSKWSIFDTQNYDSSWISSSIKLIERTKLEND